MMLIGPYCIFALFALASQEASWRSTLWPIVLISKLSLYVFELLLLQWYLNISTCISNLSLTVFPTRRPCFPYSSSLFFPTRWSSLSSSLVLPVFPACLFRHGAARPRKSGRKRPTQCSHLPQHPLQRKPHHNPPPRLSSRTSRAPGKPQTAQTSLHARLPPSIRTFYRRERRRHPRRVKGWTETALARVRRRRFRGVSHILSASFRGYWGAEPGLQESEGRDVRRCAGRDARARAPLHSVYRCRVSQRRGHDAKHREVTRTENRYTNSKISLFLIWNPSSCTESKAKRIV
ncbi:hypothetical protein BDV98DRAFT_173498 [Pterulicium gracile]|uniref:Uncharacterized protein n=1 Tax=Pterulicium gracile TaxID=1884261 RepID=A0A5C3QMJ1_9AGAR|nr:hypothetical protein BDV98DRAFT_173498 [Pterula gracilis]